MDFVGGDAEFDLGQRKRAQAAREEQRGAGQQIASGRRVHAEIIAAGAPGFMLAVWQMTELRDATSFRHPAGGRRARRRLRLGIRGRN